MNVTTGQGSNDCHPDHSMALAEAYVKDIYEAVRASPAWPDTLFVVTFDEHGGFYDHVVPPSKDVPPPGDGEKSYPDRGFLFDRLGVRVPTLLISPWIKKGSVLTTPPDEAKPTPSSEYELTSIIASTRKLLNMDTGPLTNRDAWSATFDHAILELDEARTDCPLHLPDALPPAMPQHGVIQEAEQDFPLNDLQTDIAAVISHLGNKGGMESRGAAKDRSTEGIDITARGDYPRVQGQLSQFLQDNFASHSDQTKQWLQSKATKAAGSQEGKAQEVARVTAKVKDKCVYIYTYMSVSVCLSPLHSCNY